MSELTLSGGPGPSTVLLTSTPGATELDLAGGQAPTNVLADAGTDPGVLSTDIVAIKGDPGAKGDKGDPGDSGTGGGAVVINFATATDTWTATHSLGFVPNVGLQGQDGKGIRGHVESNDEISTVVSYYWPTAGRMILS